MTTVKWYLSSSGSSLILLNYLRHISFHILILVLSIIQQDNELGAIHFAMRYSCIKVYDNNLTLYCTTATTADALKRLVVLHYINTCVNITLYYHAHRYKAVQKILKMFNSCSFY